MTLEEKELKIIEHYGVMPQLKYFQSEVFELNEAIIRYEQHLRDNLGNVYDDILLDNITEEMADVMLMINQFKEYYKIKNEDLYEIMQFKADRQLKRMEEE